VTTTARMSERATRWGRLWGSRARDWAASEEQQLPTYEEAIRRVGISEGRRVLEVGCGTGVFLRAAADRGAEVHGLDASEALLELARERVPEADLRLGDMEALPYEDDRFDVVAGFNAFFFAVDIVAALREAGRVAKPGAPVVIQVWGRHDRCDLEAMKAVVRPFMPPRPPDAPPEPELWAPGVLEEIATAAGLTPASAFDVSWAYEYSDDAELGRALLAPAGIGDLVGPAQEEAVRRQIVEALAPYRTPEGGYRLENEFHFLIASA
jgi:SAM-dependent methyltransferase